MWRESEVAGQYPDVELSHMYIDNATMQLIKDPSQFDVLLCSNLFGDILSDECAMITGSMGMLPSASLNEECWPVRTGGRISQVKTSPTRLRRSSPWLLLRCNLDAGDAATAIENAINRALEEGVRTGDLARGTAAVGTDEMGDIIARYVAEGA
ncbi:isocitrate/isopropylmalate family dehydrogenase [Enterobacter hormaechei]|uniref:isocitrate/isopropylmalate family dehydrogenase n=1 Tax=Enterobacter hormaechei TaxID=158836 RepID=UPI0024E15112|nr:isocitrate/isopropylmalate family dehydrogenase [Enterobacter hormaechei]WIF24789.1 isocitrate/isopropylmalate family dehydrogenase [Enterobacter hormaechei]